MRGDLIARSTATNTTNNTAPAPMHAQMIGLCQPQIADCCRPNTLNPTPDAISTRPR